MFCAYEKFFDLLFTTRRLRRRGMRLCHRSSRLLPEGLVSLLSGINHKKEGGKGHSTFCCIGRLQALADGGSRYGGLGGQSGNVAGYGARDMA